VQVGGDRTGNRALATGWRNVCRGRTSDLGSRLLDVPHDGVSTMRACDGMRLVERCERVRAAVLGGV